MPGPAAALVRVAVFRPLSLKMTGGLAYVISRLSLAFRRASLPPRRSVRPAVRGHACLTVRVRASFPPNRSAELSSSAGRGHVRIGRGRESVQHHARLVSGAPGPARGPKPCPVRPPSSRASSSARQGRQRRAWLGPRDRGHVRSGHGRKGVQRHARAASGAPGLTRGSRACPHRPRARRRPASRQPLVCGAPGPAKGSRACPHRPRARGRPASRQPLVCGMPGDPLRPAGAWASSAAPGPSAARLAWPRDRGHVRSGRRAQGRPAPRQGHQRRAWRSAPAGEHKGVQRHASRSSAACLAILRPAGAWASSVVNFAHARHKIHM